MGCAFSNHNHKDHVKKIGGNKMLELNKENFENEVLKSNSPVIIDFWAEWCMPCKMMGPVFEELSKFYGERLKFGKVNTETAPELSSQFGISGIPSLLVINKGEVIDRIVGFNPKDALKQKIDSILEKL